MARVKGAILLEPLVAIIIISAVMTYATFTINNLFKNKNSYQKFKALIELERYILTDSTTTNFENENEQYILIKNINQSTLANDLKEIHWIILDKRTEQKLGELVELKLSEDEY